MTGQEKEDTLVRSSEPVSYQLGSPYRMMLRLADSGQREISGLTVDAVSRRQLFSRTDEIRRIDCYFKDLNRNT